MFAVNRCGDLLYDVMVKTCLMPSLKEGLPYVSAVLPVVWMTLCNLHGPVDLSILFPGLATKLVFFHTVEYLKQAMLCLAQRTLRCTIVVAPCWGSEKHENDVLVILNSGLCSQPSRFSVSLQCPSSSTCAQAGHSGRDGTACEVGQLIYLGVTHLLEHAHHSFRLIRTGLFWPQVLSSPGEDVLALMDLVKELEAASQLHLLHSAQLELEKETLPLDFTFSQFMKHFFMINSVI